MLKSFLGLKWQKDNTSVENLECKSTNTNGSVCTVWFQVSNRLYYSCYHLSIRGLRQWNFCIYHVTRQLLEHFCKLHSAKMRHIVEYAEVTVTGISLVWSTSCIIFFHEFLCSEVLSGRAWADKSDLIVFTTLPWLMMMIDYCWRYRKFSKKRFWRRLGNQVMFGFCHTRFFIAFHQ